MLSFEGVAAERAVRLRALADVGWAVSIGRASGDDGELCVIEGHDRRFTGRGPDADAAAADALARFDERDPPGAASA
jgi:hypothetical protein